jgi:hypothetical protein
MRPVDLALALLVVVVWGLNFAVIKTGVAEVPPLLLGALRFLLAAFPAVFLLRPPKVPWRLYLAYGMTISVGQFAFLFSAIHLGMPSGLASLVLQSQAFFTMLFAALWLREGWRRSQLAGLVLAAWRSGVDRFGARSVDAADGISADHRCRFDVGRWQYRDPRRCALRSDQPARLCRLGKSGAAVAISRVVLADRRGGRRWPRR